jgi:hypothetical protein
VSVVPSIVDSSDCNGLMELVPVEPPRRAMSGFVDATASEELPVFDPRRLVRADSAELSVPPELRVFDAARRLLRADSPVPVEVEPAPVFEPRAERRLKRDDPVVLVVPVASSA